MMKVILIMLLSLLLMSCGSRTKDINKSEVRSQSEYSQNSSGESTVNVNRKNAELNVSDLSKAKISVIPQDRKCIGSDKSEPKNMTVKDSKGNETIIPVYDNSEIHLENTDESESKLIVTELQLEKMTKEKAQIQAKNDELQKQLESSLKSSRPVFWLYIICFLGGIFTVLTFKYYFKR